MHVALIAYNWETNTSLALWNLELYAKQDPVIAKEVEFTQYCAPTPKSMGEEERELFAVLKWIRDVDADVVGFSCYVWNVAFVNRITEAIKEMWPDKKVVYGGQQIRGYYTDRLFELGVGVDICVENEAEISFQRLLLNLVTGSPALAEIGGLAYMSSGGAVHRTGPAELVDDLNLLPTPYLGAVELPWGASFLYEASRGCPYKCSFCIWGESSGVREYDMERVEQELDNLLKHQPTHIMFCDGTFNMRKERARHILEILVDHLEKGTIKPFSLLLEQKLELIDDKLVAVLDRLLELNPLVTFEFGLQSTSPEASKLMQRPFSEKRFRAAWDRLTPHLKSMAIIDCIYGLPGDGVEQFKDTVDFVYSLGPHRIQAFRLAVLPGSEFDRHSEAHGFKFSRDPDHFVFETKWIGLDEMAWLEAFGFAVSDLYHFHGTTIQCLLGSTQAFPTFSALITDFVDWAGRERILGSLMENNRPEGRWRAIDLSPLFTEFVLQAVFPRLNLEESTKERYRELLKYETALGAVAGRGLEASSRFDGGPEVRAKVVVTKFDIASFMRERNRVGGADILDLEEKDTFIAIGLKAGHQGVKIPISYNITKEMAHLLNGVGLDERFQESRASSNGKQRKGARRDKTLESLGRAGLLVLETEASAV